MRKSVVGVFLFGVFGALIAGLWRAYGSRLREAAGNRDWEGAPFPFPPVPRPVAQPAASSVPAAPTPIVTAAWVEPIDGACPATHPIKAKLSSGIYHQPGGMNYERTNADRCYADPEAADGDGLRPAKR
jgi:hypothetical protein